MRKIALFGLGTVGSGVFQHLQADQHPQFELKYIVVKNTEKERPLSGFQNYLNSFETAINDPEIEVVLEMINDEEEAYKIVKQALLKGKAVVSASKKMLAKNLKELSELAKQQDSQLLFEAAVCGSIPILTLLGDYYYKNPIKSIRAIANGTSNYILESLFDQDLAYEEVLQNAQSKGLAESDPTDDVSGGDASSKLSLLVAKAFGAEVLPSAIPTIGIAHIDTGSLTYFRSKQLKVKLISEAVHEEGVLKVRTIPHLIDQEDCFYHIEQEENVVEVDNLLSGKQIFKGKGAGSFPTAQAMLADLYSLSQNRRATVFNSQLNVSDTNEDIYYISGDYADLLRGQVLLRSDHFTVVESNIQSIERLANSGESVFVAQLSRRVYENYFTI